MQSFSESSWYKEGTKNYDATVNLTLKDEKIMMCAPQ